MADEKQVGVLPRKRRKNRAFLWLFPVIAVFLSASLTALGADFALRVFGKKIFYYRPNEMFLEKWPKLPLVYKYKKNVFYEGETFGDLAAMLDEDRFREKRRVTFETDAFGFCNTGSCSGAETYDVIILGDSFGVGLGTSQNKAWAAQLKKRHGVSSYNLSISGGGPWQSYVHFASEVERIPVHSRSIVLVTVFSGNDLDDFYYDRQVTFSDLPWNSPWESFAVSMNCFVKRSPVFQLFNRLNHGNSKCDKVLIRELPDGRVMLFYAPYFTSKNRTAEMVCHHTNYPRLLNAVHAISREAADHGLKTVILLLPCKEEIYEWVIAGEQPWENTYRQSGLSATLEDVLGKENIRFFDLGQPLADAAEKAWEESGELIYWTDDTHWNEKGHTIVADIINGAVFDRSLSALNHQSKDRDGR